MVAFANDRRQLSLEMNARHMPRGNMREDPYRLLEEMCQAAREYHLRAHLIDSMCNAGDVRVYRVGGSDQFHAKALDLPLQRGCDGGGRVG